MRTLTVTLAALLALAAAGPTGAAKPAKPARVQASIDFLYVENCLFDGLSTSTGHIELDGYDDDLTTSIYSDTPQNDRISFRVTWAGGGVWDTGAIALLVSGNDAILSIGGWGTPFTFHDGGNPGTGLTGETFNGVPATADWARYRGVSLCGRGYFFVTSGNIKITPGS